MYEEKEEDDEQWPVAQVIVPANALEYLQSITSNLRSLPAFGSPGQDQMPLKLRKAAKDRKHQLAMWRGAVCPGIAKGAEASPGFVNRRQGVEQITSAQPI